MDVIRVDRVPIVVAPLMTMMMTMMTRVRGCPHVLREKVRNTETCACECETVLACSEAHLATWNPETCQCDCKDEDHIYAYCGISEEGIPEDQKKENNEVCDCVCPQGKTECGSNRCCDLCNADNTRCCDAESICVNDECCGENEICLHIGCCVEDNVCGEGEAATCCGDEETCVNGTCCATENKCGEGENAECCEEGEDCCKDTCCSVDEVCADKATGTCCPMETPVKYGEECCENGCNKEGNGCSICEKGQQECGEKYCSETQECCNDECYDKCSQGFGRNSACQCNECETEEDCGLSLGWECSFGKCINEEELQANCKEQLELYYSGKGYTATIEGPFKDRGTCCGYYEDDGSFYYNCVIKDPNAEEWEAIIVEYPICSDPCLCYGC